GQNSSKPHAVPGNYQARPGDFITLDFGCTIDGYRSDMTRTVAIGHVSDKQREVYALVHKAQTAALRAIRAGVSCESVDKIARSIIDITRYKGLFGHGLGHSLGLEIHEPPRLAKNMDEELPENCVMSVEPGIYIPGEFGVRIEDIVIATREGHENLTRSTKELIII
ncbi:MAG: M24 family metallopeptidase, partial [Oscillospiraceae bacterium]|nr:M24 family metallopeptidase [Oscillospiraceae bacterium]